MGRHDSRIDNARDELMSHIVRCQVLQAELDERMTWLDETMDYIADRYNHLSDMELAKVEIMGRQYLKPVIPHGKEHTALTRDRGVQAA